MMRDVKHLEAEDGDHRLWPCCRDCRRREDCPYVCDQILCNAADQGNAMARRLKAEARQLRGVVASCSDICRVRDSADALEHMLLDALRSEMDLIDRLCAQMKQYRSGRSLIW